MPQANIAPPASTVARLPVIRNIDGDPCVIPARSLEGVRLAPYGNQPQRQRAGGGDSAGVSAMFTFRDGTRILYQPLAVVCLRGARRR